MTGRIAALYRHPVKGFTPEALQAVMLTAGAHFPCDRLYAVEDGPSGFDPAAPGHLSKMRFTVLAKIPALARARTAYDEESGVFHIAAPGRAPFAACLDTGEGRAAFEAWLLDFLAEHEPDETHGPLKVLNAQGHRFMDSRKGYVSILNLESVRDLAQKLGRPVEPERFRANVLVEGWPAWSEYGRTGETLRLGDAELTVLSDTVRCIATHVDPATGDKDIDMVPEIFAQQGHMCCGLYAQVTNGGRLAVGDVALAPAA
jgi:uncharacterized protein YcbX